MLKKSFKSFSVFIATVVLGVMLLPSVTFASDLHLTRASIIHSVSVPGYGETVKYLYLQPAEARKVAASVRIGDGRGIALYMVSLIPGSVFSAALLSGIAFCAQSVRSTAASNIESLSESGPVEIRIEYSRYGTNYLSSHWDSTYLGLNFRTGIHTDHGYTYSDTITELILDK